jgi:HPt (histidine-containing phosphotransfer) domain-containing protein
VTPSAPRAGEDDAPALGAATTNAGARDAGQSTQASSRAERIAAAIERVWAQRRLAVFDQIEVIEAAINDLRQGRWADEQREPALRESHKLAGSLGTFGFSQGTNIAREMESILARGLAIEDIDAARLSELLAELRQELRHGARHPDITGGS